MIATDFDRQPPQEVTHPTNPRHSATGVLQKKAATPSSEQTPAGSSRERKIRSNNSLTVTRKLTFRAGCAIR